MRQKTSTDKTDKLTRISASIPEKMEKKIIELAAEERRSFSHMVVLLLEQALEKRGK